MIEEILFKAAMSAGQKTASKIGAKLVTGFAGSIATTAINNSIVAKCNEELNTINTNLEKGEYKSKEEVQSLVNKVSIDSYVKPAIVTSVIGAAGMGLMKLAECLIEKSN